MHIQQRIQLRAPITDTLAVDCEMVEVGTSKKESALARVCVVNYLGDVIIDEYVRPEQRISDFRTRISGIRP